MVYHRLKVVDCHGARVNDSSGEQQERLFNFDALQWWIGRGDLFTELQFAAQPPVFVEVGHRDMERLTGTTGGYASGG